MLISYTRGQGSIVMRVKILNSSVATGAGLTGLTFESAGLIIGTIADNEATTTTYTQAAGKIETINTLGTYAAPTATKCRFKEVDSTNHPGVVEIHLANARYAVASAKSLVVSISGATNCAETDAVVPLVDLDPYVAMRGTDSAALAATALSTAVWTAARAGVLSDWINGGRLDLLLDAIPTTAMRGTDGANTTTPPTAAAVRDAVWAAVARTLTGTVTTDAASQNASKATGFSTHSAADVNAALTLAHGSGTWTTGTGGDATEAKQDTAIADIASMRMVVDTLVPGAPVNVNIETELIVGDTA